jgi:acyl carrier protein
MTEATRRNAVVGAVLHAIGDTNEMLPPGHQLEVSEQAALLETPGQLDSLALVNLLVAVESRCADALARPISLVDSLGAPPETSPFRNVATLVDHICSGLDHQGGHE